MRSALPLSGPPPRSNGPASAATANAPAVGNGRPNAAATSTTHPPSDQSFLQRPRLRPGAPDLESSPEDEADGNISPLSALLTMFLPASLWCSWGTGCEDRHGRRHLARPVGTRRRPGP